MGPWELGSWGGFRVSQEQPGHLLFHSGSVLGDHPTVTQLLYGRVKLEFRSKPQSPVLILQCPLPRYEPFLRLLARFLGSHREPASDT